jgi:hypothetical protein
MAMLYGCDEMNFDGTAILWKKKKNEFPHWRVRRARESNLKKKRGKNVCVGREQEGKSGQQRIEVKATCC